MRTSKFYLAHLNRTIREGGAITQQTDGVLVVTDRYGVPRVLTLELIAQLDRESQRALAYDSVTRPVPSRSMRRQSRSSAARR